MTARELERLLKKHGFEQVSQRGSHAKYRNSETGRQVIVPTHSSREIPIGTLKQILEGSGIPDSEWTN